MVIKHVIYQQKKKINILSYTFLNINLSKGILFLTASTTSENISVCTHFLFLGNEWNKMAEDAYCPNNVKIAVILFI